MTTLGTVSYAIIEGPGYGWASAPVLACFAVAPAALAVFGWYEPRREQDVRGSRIPLVVAGADDPVPAGAA